MTRKERIQMAKGKAQRAKGLKLAICQIVNHWNFALRPLPFALFLALLLASPAGAGWTLKNDKGGYGATNPTSTAAFANALTNGSLIIVTAAVATSGAAIPTPTDTAGNTYRDSGAGMVSVGASGYYVEIFYAENSFTTAGNVVSMPNSAGYQVRVEASEWTGGLTASPVDVWATNANASSGTGGGQNCTSNAATTTYASGELILGFIRPTSALPSAGTGFTALQQPAGAVMPEYMVQSSVGSVAATWSDSANNDHYGALMVAFEPARAYSATPTETNTVSDSISSLAAHYANLSETHVTSDSLASQAAHSAKMTDTNTASDALASQAAHFALLAETNPVSDTLTRQAAYWRGDCISLNWTPPPRRLGEFGLQLQHLSREQSRQRKRAAQLLPG